MNSVGNHSAVLEFERLLTKWFYSIKTFSSDLAATCENTGSSSAFYEIRRYITEFV
jgi:hypothetical protein